MKLLKIVKGWLEIPAGLSVNCSHECEVVETSHPWEKEDGPIPEGWEFHPNTYKWTYRDEDIFIPDTEEAVVVEMATMWVSSDAHELSDFNPGESWVEVVNRGSSGDGDPDYDCYQRSWRPAEMLVARVAGEGGMIKYFQI